MPIGNVLIAFGLALFAGLAHHLFSLDNLGRLGYSMDAVAWGFSLE